jgi:threonyl-tRNA synthetase
MLVVGSKEEQQHAVSVRVRKVGDKGLQPVAEIAQALLDEIVSKQ